MALELEEFKVKTEFVNYNNVHLLSDIHFGVRSNSVEWLQNQIQFFKEFYIPYLNSIKEDNDILIICGDVFDNRQLLDITVLNNVIDLFIELSLILPVLVMVGNHDVSKRNENDINSLKPFRFIPNVTVYEKPVVITNKNSTILLLPWVGDFEKEEAYVLANQTDYVLAHTDMIGFKYDNFKEIKKGADFVKMKHFKRIFLGHIHKRQEFNDKFIYIGSPYHTKRSDIGNQKGVYKLNPDTDTVVFTPNNLSSVFQRIKLEDILEYKLKDIFSIFNNNYTDIIVSDRHTHLFNVSKFIELLNGCTYKKIEIVSEKTRLDDSITDLNDTVDIKDILTLLEMNLTDAGYDTELLIRLKLLNRKYYDNANKGENLID